jgi:hypothetical protein
VILTSSVSRKTVPGTEDDCNRVKIPAGNRISRNAPWKAEVTMHRTSPQLDPRHRRTQAWLRTLGPVVLGLGGVFTAVGLFSFFSSFGTFEPPRHFWAAFIGLPLIAVGLALTRLGYLGAFYGYFFREVSPVAQDTFNTMAEGTRQGVQTMAHAVGRGLAAGMGGGVPSAPETFPCERCQAPNPEHARFCNQCGTALKNRVCPGCGAALAPTTRFCSECGKPID